MSVVTTNAGTTTRGRARRRSLDRRDSRIAPNPRIAAAIAKGAPIAP
jgi:hypothetical protein